MPISAGDMLPDVTLMTMTAEGQIEISSTEFFAGKKAILFGVPGAFTPTCHKQHLPGFMAKEDELRAKGVDVIACLSVNDAHVMDAWKKQTGAGRGIAFLADGNGDFTSRDRHAVRCFGFRAKASAQSVMQ